MTPPPSRAPVSMQITLTPSDLQEVRHFLPHQLRIWAGQVDEVLLLVDVPPAKAGRDGAMGSLGELREVLEKQRRSHRHLDWRLVDYSPEARRQVELTFYGGRSVPDMASPVWTFWALARACGRFTRASGRPGSSAPFPDSSDSWRRRRSTNHSAGVRSHQPDVALGRVGLRRLDPRLSGKWHAA